MTERADVVVLGAGVAGLSTAHALVDTDLDVLVLEARDRLGGRVHTDRSFAGFPLEFGAEFVHGERVPTWEWLERLGLKTVHWNKQDDSWVRMADGTRLTMAEARASDPRFDVTRSWALPDVPARPLESFGRYLQRIGFEPAQIDYVRRAFANAAGESLRHLDAASMLDSITGAGDTGHEDFRIVEGYGAVLEALGIGAEIRTRAQVERVEQTAEGVSAFTTAGEEFAAKLLVCTLPVGVLAAGDVEFVPGLPPATLQALRGLGMGPAVKCVYRFREPITPPGIKAIYASGRAPMWWTPSFGHETDAVVWTAFLTGDAAMDLLRRGEEEALDDALESLRRELGRPGLQAVDAQLVDWVSDPYARGGYSYVRPGHRGARELLAEPTPPILWAGEATSPEADAATVHGALQSGRRAAREVLELLKPRAYDGGEVVL
ncbi:MAG TPA: NAD(P)/FAD-dependent oxidoreductase [Trueperaceae bacterium]|nr:NAD(P)/FAD-dependent oxidoreductase [Trueperaceae bacterium]